MEQQPASGSPTRGEVSPDKQFVWDGTAWRAVTGWRWEPTELSRPLHLAVVGYWAILALYSFAIPLLFYGQLRDVALRQMQRSTSELPPDQLQQALNLAMTVTVAVILVIGVFYAVAAVLSWFRWSWMFYVNLVLLAFSLISIVQALIALFNPANAQSPPALSIASLIISLVGLGLFAWLLYVRLRVGVWGGRRTPVF